MAGAARENGVKLLCVIIPEAIQVSEALYWEKELEKWKVNRWKVKNSSDDTFQKIVGKTALENDIDFIDLFPLMQRAGTVETSDFHFPPNGHLAPAGHNFVAKILKEHIITTGIEAFSCYQNLPTASE